MPSGRTHDSITLWCLPIVTGGTWFYTHSPALAIVTTGSYLFAGLMFGPDLDIYSHQYKRWGPLRWLWLPYRQLFRHRSVYSHGFLIGTVLRILYVTGLLLVAMSFGILGWAIALHYQGVMTWDRAALPLTTQVLQPIAQSMQTHWQIWLAVWFGLETGAMSHSVSDAIGSQVKRWRRGSRKSSQKVSQRRYPKK
jgi:uncharacterized metal-binding protein